MVTPKLAVMATVSSFHGTGVRELAAKRVGDTLRSLERGFGQQHEELFTAVSAFQIAGAEQLAHATADRGQHCVATLMTVTVVDVLEVIDVEHDQRDRRLRAARPPELDVDRINRVRAVEASGQAIAQAVVANLVEELGVADTDREQRRRHRHRPSPPFRERALRDAHDADQMSARGEWEADMSLAGHCARGPRRLRAEHAIRDVLACPLDFAAGFVQRPGKRFPPSSGSEQHPRVVGSSQFGQMLEHDVADCLDIQ